MSKTTSITVFSIPGIGFICPGHNVSAIIIDALNSNLIELSAGDILCICSKIISKSENRFVDLATIKPRPEAEQLSTEVDKDPRLVELILRESTEISRKREGALIVRHRLGIVSANAAIDASNSRPQDALPDSGPWVLLLPEDPDKSAAKIQKDLSLRLGFNMGVVITDSLGRPFRVGTVGAAIGVAGISAIWDQRGLPDSDGRAMECTITAFADQVAAAADLVAGQGAEGTPFIIVRGLRWPALDSGRTNTAQDLIRDPEMDLYA